MKKLLFSCFLVIGCTVEGKLTDESKNKWMKTVEVDSLTANKAIE